MTKDQTMPAKNMQLLNQHKIQPWKKPPSLQQRLSQHKIGMKINPSIKHNNGRILQADQPTSLTVNRGTN